MTKTLPEPEVLRSFFDDHPDVRLPALSLRWGNGDGALLERLWELPEGVTLFGPPPRRFGLAVDRHGRDSYRVRLLWDQTRLSWTSLSRAQLLTSSLAPLLAALGTDLWALLDQPLGSALDLPRAAA
jgi:hypothetical protein